MPTLPDPEPGYAWHACTVARLHGEVILAPVEAHRSLPASTIRVLAPLLDEQAETIEWRPVTYVCPVQYRPKAGEPWRHSSIPVGTQVTRCDVAPPMSKGNARLTERTRGRRAMISISTRKRPP